MISSQSILSFILLHILIYFIFTHLKLCLATTINNFKSMKIMQL